MTVFFPQTQKEFKGEWPVEPLTEKEIADTGSIQKAMANKNKALDIVSSQHTCQPVAKTHLPFSILKIGLTTTSKPQHQEMGLVEF